MIAVIWLFLAGAGAAYAVNVAPGMNKYSFNQCLVTQPSLGYCVGLSALGKLQSIDNDPAFDLVDGVTFTRDDQQPRNLYNFLERDPSDFGGILDTMSSVMSYRTLRWDMGTLYPGLVLRVTPSVNGVLEFVMDPHQDDLALKSRYKELGTARILARQFLLPVLLGFKFKVATLIPLIFGLLALLAKKALVLSKAALVISSSLALGSLLLGSSSHTPPIHHHATHYGGGGGYDPHIPSWNGLHHGYKSEEPIGDYSDVVYKGYTSATSQDQLKFMQMPMQQQYERNNNNDGRNFAWNDSEKEVKT